MFRFLLLLSLPFLLVSQPQSADVKALGGLGFFSKNVISPLNNPSFWNTDKKWSSSLSNSRSPQLSALNGQQLSIACQWKRKLLALNIEQNGHRHLQRSKLYIGAGILLKQDFALALRLGLGLIALTERGRFWSNDLSLFTSFKPWKGLYVGQALHLESIGESQPNIFRSETELCYRASDQFRIMTGWQLNFQTYHSWALAFSYDLSPTFSLKQGFRKQSELLYAAGFCWQWAFISCHFSVDWHRALGFRNYLSIHCQWD
jgi:hypothetical protein